MKFSATTFATALCLTGASAHPNAQRREALAARGETLAFDLANLAKRTKKKGAFLGNKFATGGPGGYAGLTAVDTGIVMVTGTVVVPNVQVPPGAPSGTDYLLGTWVGIQGNGALWQAGLTASVNTTGATYGLFWEEADNLPEESFSDPFSYGAGDTISMTVTVSGANSGTAVLVNEGSQQTAMITKQGLSATIGSTNANWIVEDPGLSGGSAPFAAWSGAWQWSNCAYSTGNGAITTFSSNEISEISENGTPLTQTSILSNNAFSMTYVGTSAQTGQE